MVADYSNLFPDHQHIVKTRAGIINRDIDIS